MLHVTQKYIVFFQYFYLYWDSWLKGSYKPEHLCLLSPIKSKFDKPENRNGAHCSTSAISNYVWVLTPLGVKGPFHRNCLKWSENIDFNLLFIRVAKLQL